MSQSKKILIKGINAAGRTFRPSDWAERMCGNLCSFRNRRMYYSPLLRPAIVDGIKCVYVDPRLSELHPNLYKEVTGFAIENGLIQEEVEES